MALISVIQPNQSQPKKTTWDRVVEGIGVVNSVLGTGINAANLYNQFEETGLKREQLGIQKQQMEAEKQKSALDFYNQYEAADPTDPTAFQADLNSIVGVKSDPAKPQFWRKKPTEWESNDFLAQNRSGNLEILTDPAKISDYKAKNFPVHEIRVKGVSTPYTVLVNVENLKKNAGLNTKKSELENEKLAEDVRRSKMAGNEDQNKGADELRKEFEAKPEIRNARDIIAIADRADEFVKGNSVSDQVALAYGFIRAQGPGVVSQQELDLASRGAFTDEMLQKFGWKRLSDGRFMTPEQVRGVSDTLKTTAKSLIKTIGPQIQTYSRLAKERGFNVDDVVIPLSLRQEQLFKELDPSYLINKPVKEMSPLEKEIFQKNYGNKK